MTHAHPIALTDTLGAIAAASPVAAGLFRGSGLSFCCGGAPPWRRPPPRPATTRRPAGRDRRAGRGGRPRRAAPQETDALIDHIDTRYHAVHREELADLILLAEKVECVHGEHPAAPRSLADLLRAMAAEMDDHMTKEEQILFPMTRAGGNPMIVHPIAAMRHDHDGHVDQLRVIEHITQGLTPPEGACGSWALLYAGVEKFADDLVTHMHLENDILVPRFEG